MGGVGTTLAAAFADDPLWTWLSAPSPHRQDRAAAWFTKEAAMQHAGHGEVLVDDQLRGAAVWSPPGRWKTAWSDTVGLARPSLRLFRGRTVRALRILSAMEGAHPTDPEHWYLAILGTDPAHQGHGIGGALIEAVTSRCDAEGLPAYLESSKEQNVGFYRRHGFEVTKEQTFDGGPSIWLMWRDPTP